jgi:ribosome recycling factor
VIRLPIPALTEERRKELVKVLHKLGEEIKTAVRNVRRDSNEHLKRIEKDKQNPISEDLAKKTLDQIQKTTDEHIKEIDEILKHKEAEILKV